MVELDAREAAARLRFQVEKAVAALEHDSGGYGIKRA
jgi:hypothetical protein